MCGCCSLAHASCLRYSARQTHFAWDAHHHGTRFIQPPLCSPMERQRRLPTVAFQSGYADAEADPVAARWLPLLVYETLLPAGAVRQAPLSSTVVAPGNGSSSVGGGEGTALPMSGGQAGAPPSGSDNGVGTAQREAWLAAGWRLLRHGATPPSYGAHWSTYYERHARQPQVIALAPWVAKRWERRQQRAASSADASQLPASRAD